MGYIDYLPLRDFSNNYKKKKNEGPYQYFPVTGISQGGGTVQSGGKNFIVNDVKISEEYGELYYDVLSNGRWYRINPRTNMMWTPNFCYDEK